LLPNWYKLVPEKTMVSADSVIVFQLNEEDGSIFENLASVDGIPSDKNYLNDITCGRQIDLLIILEMSKNYEC